MAKKTKMKISKEGMHKIAKHFGYKGDMAKFRQYLASDPAKQHLMNRYYDKAKKLYANKGTAVGSNPQYDALKGQYDSGEITLGQFTERLKSISPVDSTFYGTQEETDRIKAQAKDQGVNTLGEIDTSKPPSKVNPIEKGMQDMAKNPQLTAGQTVTPKKIDVTQDQLISKGTGQLSGTDPQATFVKADTAGDVTEPTAKKAETITADTSKEDVKAATDKVDAEELDRDSIDKITAEQQTKSSVSDLKAAEGEGILMDDPKKRTLEEGE